MKTLLVLVVVVAVALAEEKKENEKKKSPFKSMPDAKMGLEHEVAKLVKRVSKLEKQEESNKDYTQRISKWSSDLHKSFNNLLQFTTNLNKAFTDAKRDFSKVLEKQEEKGKSAKKELEKFMKDIHGKAEEFGGYLKEHGKYIKKAFDWLELLQKQVDKKADQISQADIDKYLTNYWEKMATEKAGKWGNWYDWGKQYGTYDWSKMNDVHKKHHKHHKNHHKVTETTADSDSYLTTSAYPMTEEIVDDIGTGRNAEKLVGWLKQKYDKQSPEVKNWMTKMYNQGVDMWNNKGKVETYVTTMAPIATDNLYGDTTGLPSGDYMVDEPMVATTSMPITREARHDRGRRMRMLA